jgi:hypothetical protein
MQFAFERSQIKCTLLGEHILFRLYQRFNWRNFLENSYLALPVHATKLCKWFAMSQ